VTSHALDPSPVTNCHTFSNPLERDVLYGRPLSGWVDGLVSGWAGTSSTCKVWCVSASWSTLIKRNVNWTKMGKVY